MAPSSTLEKRRGSPHPKDGTSAFSSEGAELPQHDVAQQESFSSSAAWMAREYDFATLVRICVADVFMGFTVSGEEARLGPVDFLVAH